ncbi:MAG: Xylose isomerase-like TIM barrel [Lentisphaerae bacterium ADurb.Bin242]|nr:MAG: Xylose isomerase-like TIM barrel [Lentisphaerae bacterium ADurb.Bin242]
MLLTRPLHSPEFLKAHHLGVEAHIGRYDRLPGWEQYIPFVHGVHLPYAGYNLAAIDAEMRLGSIAALKAAIDEGCRYPVDRMVIHTIGIRHQHGVTVGDYELLIRSFRELAAYAADRHIILCIENQLMQKEVKRFGDNSSEWLALHTDIDRDNVLLTLDTSHASTSVSVYDTHEERLAKLEEYLSHPELIGRLHWSDAKLTNREAYFNDMHLVPGKGDLPLEFHRKLKRLKVIKLLEQKCTETDVLEGLNFIAAL